MSEDTPPVPPPLAELLTGRSLTMREYLEVVLRWIDRHCEERIGPWRDPFAGDESRLADLREHIQSAEIRKMFHRVGAGEDWHAIKASTRGGRVD
jgi:hypothetical protein